MAEKTNFVRIRLQLDAASSSMSTARKCWLLVNVSQSQAIADLIHVISNRFQVTNNCSLYLDDYWLPPGESTKILKDNDIIKVLSSERADNLNYEAVLPFSKKLRVISCNSSNSSSSSSSSSSAEDNNVQISQGVNRTSIDSNIKSSIKCNTTVLQSGAVHTVFNDSDIECLINNENVFTKVAPSTSSIQESKKSVEAVSQNTGRNRRRRNRKKAKKFEQIQKSVGGNDDVLIAVSKIFKNPTDSEDCLETKHTNNVGLSVNNDNLNGQEVLPIVDNENTGDDFGVDFTADFDSYPELSGAPRVGDLLVYKELEMSSTYTPEVSAYKVCKVISLNSSSLIEVKLSWTTYKAECAKAVKSQNRKFEFDNPVSEEATSLVEKEFELKLDCLHTTRLIPLT